MAQIFAMLLFFLGGGLKIKLLSRKGMPEIAIGFTACRFNESKNAVF